MAKALDPKVLLPAIIAGVAAMFIYDFAKSKGWLTIPAGA
jgi:hypothetical protein